MPAYSRDETVSAVLNFYNYLASIGAIPESAIKPAPDSGWEDISAETLAPLGKDDTVIDLLRHLPYISDNVDGNRQIAYQTNPIVFNWHGIKWNVEKNKIAGLLTPVGPGEIPSHVVCLTEGGRYGSWLLLDTQEGTITDYIQQERPARDQPPADSPDYWRAYETLPVVEFFHSWRQKFRSLAWVCLPHNDMDGMLLQRDARTDEIRDIYREHGWPDEFRVKDCKQALQEWEEGK